MISLVKRIFHLFFLTRPNYSGGSSDTCLSLNDWTIPEDNRIAHNNIEQSKQAKYCFNLQNNA